MFLNFVCHMKMAARRCIRFENTFVQTSFELTIMQKEMKIWHLFLMKRKPRCGSHTDKISAIARIYWFLDKDHGHNTWSHLSKTKSFYWNKFKPITSSHKFSFIFAWTSLKILFEQMFSSKAFKRVHLFFRSWKDGRFLNCSWSFLQTSKFIDFDFIRFNAFPA